MKITLKTLKQELLKLDVEPSDTILQVKQKIQKEFGHEVDHQKIIFAGKILTDEQSVESTNVTSNDFLVLMVRAPKGAPAKPAAPAASQPSSTSSTSSAPAPPATSAPSAAPSPATPAAVSTPPASAPVAVPASSSSAESQMAVGAQADEILNRLVDMGFPRSEAQAALRAAFNNPDRAVEYLMTGIPPQLAALAEGAAPSAAAPSAAASSAPSAGAAAAPASVPSTGGNLFELAQAEAARAQQQRQVGSGAFDRLRQHPQFNALRALVQSNPSMLEPVLRSLAQTNPDIMQQIQQNQAEFIRLLQEPVSAEEAQSAQQELAAMAEGGAAGGGGGGPGYIQVTPEEKEAIDRLEAMGFERSAVIEAFLACEKDETLAANYLMDHAGEFMDDDLEGAGEGPD